MNDECLVKNIREAIYDEQDQLNVTFVLVKDVQKCVGC